MQRTSSENSRRLCLALTCLLVAVTGCGNSDYNRLVTKRLGELRAELKFRPLFAATQLAGTPVKVRVPMFFRDSFLSDSAHPIDGPKIDPQRVQPPFLNLPGFKICYEGMLNDPQNGQLPYYCYLAAEAAKPGDADLVAKDLQAKLKETFKNTPDEWEIVDADTPTGKPLQWKKLRVTGEQPFRFRDIRGQVRGQVVSQNLPGIFEVWICDKTDYVVIMAWRTPVSVEGKEPSKPANDNPSLAAVGAPTITKIDLSTWPALVAGTLTVDSPAQ